VKKIIPVYDIPGIDAAASHGLMVASFGDYLKQHYEHLHHPHRHSFFHMVLFTGGSGTHTIDFTKFPVARGQAYFMRPGQVHGWQFDGEVTGYIVHFNASFFNSFLQQSHYIDRFSFFSGNAAQGVCQLGEESLEQSVNLFKTMLHELAHETTHSLDLVRLHLLQFFILTERHCAASADKMPAPQKSLVLQQFQRLIDHHFTTMRLPKQYADLLYITPNHLNALCKDMLGKTAGDLIRERVLLEAKRLLTSAGLSVAEIADGLHFEDPSYFTRFFKKYEGLTPEQFRKTNINL
jgi:AraC family transcriptional activator of pobA